MADIAKPPAGGGGETRRDFLFLAAGAFGGVGTVAAIWPFLDSMSPSAEVLALAEVEVDISPIEEGQAITVIWQGKPIFIRHRTPEEIAEAEAVSLDTLKDPETDGDRVDRPEWLVMIGVCTHLGCVPKGQRAGDPKGEYGGWLCPCHGSHYDTSGWIRKGPAPTNLPVPPYVFVEDGLVAIGKKPEGTTSS